MLIADDGIRNPALPINIGGGAGFSPSRFIGNAVSTGVSAAIAIGALITFFFIIKGGIAWITSSGDKGKLEEARNTITHAIAGLMLLVSSWAIMMFAAVLFCLPFPNFSLNNLGAEPGSNYKCPTLPGSNRGSSGGQTGDVSANCRCEPAGKCARIGDLGILGNQCFKCQADRWVLQSGLQPGIGCQVLSCANCP